MTEQARGTHVQSWVQRRLPGRGPGADGEQDPLCRLSRVLQAEPTRKMEGRGPQGATQAPPRTRPPLPALGAPGCGRDPASALPALASPRLRSSAWPGLSWGPPNPRSSVDSVPACAEPLRGPMLLTGLGGLQRWPPGDRPQPWFSQGVLSRCPAGRLGSAVFVPPSPRGQHSARAPRRCLSQTSQWSRVPHPRPPQGRVPQQDPSSRPPPSPHPDAGHLQSPPPVPGTTLDDKGALHMSLRSHLALRHLKEANIFQKPKAQRTEVSVLKPLDLNSTPPSGLTPLPGAHRGSRTEAHGCVLGAHTSCVSFLNFLIFSYQ